MPVPRVPGVMLLLIAAHGACAAITEPPPAAQNEIEHLLDYVQTSGCEFFRNGTWYGPQQAEGHLRDKYAYLIRKNQIGAAEDFIEKAATASSFSGRPYQVRCAGGAAMESGHWLRDELTRYRSATHDN